MFSDEEHGWGGGRAVSRAQGRPEHVTPRADGGRCLSVGLDLWGAMGA